MGLPSLRNKICLWFFLQQVFLLTEAEKSVYYDLSYSVNNDTIYYPGQRYGFEMYKDKYGFQESGNWYASFSYCLGEHTGTHVDAPIHFTENGLTLDEIPPSHLIDVPATVVDLEGLVFDLESPDGFTIEVEHFIKHETKHGQIPFQGVVLVHTGWSRFWPDKMKYLGYDNFTSDKPILRFPGCSEEAARWLVHERGIVGFGIDTPSVDIGDNKGNLPVHVFFAEQRLYNIENLANLHLVIQAVKNSSSRSPCKLHLFVLPLKVTGATGAPARVLAYCKH